MWIGIQLSPLQTRHHKTLKTSRTVIQKVFDNLLQTMTTLTFVDLYGSNKTYQILHDKIHHFTTTVVSGTLN